MKNNFAVTLKEITPELLVTLLKIHHYKTVLMKLCNILPICFIFFLHACTPASKIENEWTAPTQKTDSTKVFQKILFVALLRDDAARRIAEDKLVTEVKGRGVASYSYLKTIDTRSTESVVADKLRQDGFDGVIVMRLTTVDKNAIYVPGNYPSYYNSWYGYYSSTYPRFNDPGYSSQGGIYHVEVNVYSLEKNKLLWTGITSAVNTTDTNKMIDNIIASVKQKMKSQGLIK